jgi:hypothetical protein
MEGSGSAIKTDYRDSPPLVLLRGEYMRPKPVYYLAKLTEELGSAKKKAVLTARPRRSTQPQQFATRH